MRRIYVIMKTSSSPVGFIHFPRVHEAHLDQKEAKQRVKTLNAKAMTNTYSLKSVPIFLGDCYD